MSLHWSTVVVFDVPSSPLLILCIAHWTALLWALLRAECPGRPTSSKTLSDTVVLACSCFALRQGGSQRRILLNHAVRDSQLDALDFRDYLTLCVLRLKDMRGNSMFIGFSSRVSTSGSRSLIIPITYTIHVLAGRKLVRRSQKFRSKIGAVCYRKRKSRTRSESGADRTANSYTRMYRILLLGEMVRV